MSDSRSDDDGDDQVDLSFALDELRRDIEREIEKLERDVADTIQYEHKQTRNLIVMMFVIAFALVPFIEHIVVPFVETVVVPFFADAACRLPNAGRVFTHCW